MQKLILIFFSGICLCFVGQTFGSDSNQITTNQTSSAVVSTNATQRPSDAELQAAGQQVLHRVIVAGALAFVGAVAVAGFALYGAYRKFGIPGAIVVGVILAFGVVALGGFLLSF